MKKTILISLFIASVIPAFASLDFNLKYGQKNDQVNELQEFLYDKGFLTVSPTSFFGVLTLKAVKEYQLSQGLPNTGFVGQMTRSAINKELAVDVASSTEAEIAETGTSTPIIIPDVGSIVPQVVYVYQPANTGSVPVETVSTPAPKPVRLLLVSSGDLETFTIASEKSLDWSTLQFVKDGEILPVSVVSTEKQVFEARQCMGGNRQVCDIEYYTVKISPNLLSFRDNKNANNLYQVTVRVKDTEGNQVEVTDSSNMYVYRNEETGKVSSIRASMMK
jgi:hypothetical protein